jgi:hypothetical protein
MPEIISVTALILGMTVAFSAQAGAGRWRDLRGRKPRSRNRPALALCPSVTTLILQIFLRACLHEDPRLRLVDRCTGNSFAT